ncbi:hypothetical protein PV433_10315 [Paenibacillus sp. GYB004]|uniref:hypothetical protein n=1 Tax=Paenibacillus sp. GYB004 TaxID=2994393 RepID=UPI002F96C0AF
MKESEIRKIFLVIENAYCGLFTYDDYKVELWRKTLEDVPYGLAEENLLRYIRNPDNRFPPHPGVLAEFPEQAAYGPDIPNAAETRAMLDEMDAHRSLPPAPLPPCVAEMKERLRLGVQR